MFQPLYIYGPYSAKDYMGYFLDRLLRNRPVPIPAPGIQLVSLTHVEDVASMMAKVRTGFSHALTCRLTLLETSQHLMSAPLCHHTHADPMGSAPCSHSSCTTSYCAHDQRQCFSRGVD